MTKKDLFLLLFVLAFAAVIFLFLAFGRRGEGASVAVEVNGELYGEYSLLEDRQVEIVTDYGYNRLVIENGSAYMESADCPDKYCMSYKPVSHTGESIICLPHRLVVSVKGADNALDGVVQ